MPYPEAPVATDLASPERWLESRRRSRRRRLSAARAATRRRLGRRGTAVVLSLTLVGAGAAAAQSPRGGAAAPSSSAVASSIVAVQRALGVSADGVVGPQTRGAVKRFQRRHGLTPDGVVGPGMLAALGLKASAPSASASASSVSSASAPSAALQRIAACESGGDPTSVSASGAYRGKYQFTRATWRAMGGTGDPAAAPEAVQDRLAAALYARRGSSPWPVCG